MCCTRHVLIQQATISAVHHHGYGVVWCESLMIVVKAFGPLSKSLVMHRSHSSISVAGQWPIISRPVLSKAPYRQQPICWQSTQHLYWKKVSAFCQSQHNQSSITSEMMTSDKTIHIHYRRNTSSIQQTLRKGDMHIVNHPPSSQRCWLINMSHIPPLPHMPRIRLLTEQLCVALTLHVCCTL